MGFDVAAAPARVVIVIPQWRKRGELLARTGEAQAAEAAGLAQAINLDIRATVFAVISTASPATLFGSGKLEEVAALVAEHQSQLVYVDGPLSPGQQRNLEKAFKAKVIDRTGLILEIFGERARTREGALQVELAHLTYQKSRLVRSWTHLERQRGGFGFLGGPGETQIETDRRLIQERITKLKKELTQVKRTRQLQRKNRERVPFPAVALVGYTNAGKSTLFNRLTGANVVAQNQLFATLDPTLRRIKLPAGSHVILSDTVGFIADLPTQLVAAFHATLEEVTAAELILHVRDITHPETDLQSREVYKTLKELGLGVENQTPVIEVWNKMDLLDGLEKEELLQTHQADANIITISAQTGEGCQELLSLIEQHLLSSREVLTINVMAQDGEARSWLHRHGDVLEMDESETGVTYRVRLPQERAAQARQRFQLGR